MNVCYVQQNPIHLCFKGPQEQINSNIMENIISNLVETARGGTKHETADSKSNYTRNLSIGKH